MNSVRGLFLSENCYKIGPRHAIEVQWGLFYAEFRAEQNKYNYTSIARLNQKLEHFLEIANSGIWRCLLPLTTSMRFLPPPPFNGNCYKIGTRHATEGYLGSFELSSRKESNALHYTFVV